MVDHRTNIMCKRYWSMERAIERFSRFFIAFLVFEITAIFSETDEDPSNLTLDDLW